MPYPINLEVANIANKTDHVINLQPDPARRAIASEVVSVGVGRGRQKYGRKGATAGQEGDL